MVSVIVPYYNTEKYLQRCVDSITSQTYKDLEIILVNDGSTDKSGYIAKSLADSDVRIRNIDVPHGGVSRARNEGIKIASGEYIMFVDSDDWIRDTVIEHLYKTMLKKKADLVTCELLRVDDTYKEEPQKTLKYKEYDRNEYLRIFFKIDNNEWVHYPVAKLYKRELISENLFPDDIRIGEDVIGTYKAIAGAEKIIRLNEVGYYYFKNNESATSHFSEMDFDLIFVWDEMERITEGVEPDHEYASLNRGRINFTLLLRMITRVTRKNIKKNYREQEQKLLKDMKECEKQLLKAPIIKSRKVMIFMLCHFYPVTAFFCNILVHLRER
ncbi:MAG: glycosyltransferase [Eubacterium sp.]|nr:glycosyltransferase [Eubacterium sp.]